MRIGYAVGANQTVVVEVIIRSVVFVEVAAIAVDAYSVFVFPGGRLVTTKSQDKNPPYISDICG